ncbi:MAG: HpsJ family protein [Limnospira sp. PMC 1291.21]|uniref:Uncharacterized protein n=3 Tax=Limnospira TaxID=2596745 RepID=A0A9P1KE99_9CYAN|nr:MULTISPECIES: HpsJ family protein [Limnospira]EKD11607.1 hypothetical protein SPLC1_S010040 [Arthrospira platensis C1]MDC0837181.1 HpsJ family protein [Limnoraphis robusta]MDY7055423.1 HpsJ family protein [Limnospira fusiformis LS22]QJB27213.1 hypothetical protein HFV01_17305 [Limnospira fusiformis SAG 85.79]RAQ42227.1 hypothetical protein B9S53_13020 [Arthrospira sp. O9.13F]
MTQSDGKPLNDKIEVLWKFSSNLLKTIPPLRAVGYGLLFLSMLDLLTIILPPQLMNPVWEFQTMGGIVERSAVPLISLVFIFFGERNLRGRFEEPLLMFMSWFSLLLGVLFILMVPLGIFNTLRIEQQSSEQIDSQVEQRITDIQTVQQQLEQTTSEDQMRELISRLDTQGRSPDIQNREQVNQIKEELSGFLSTTAQRTQIEAEQTRRNRRITLFKNSVKWNIGALVSGVLFVTIWRGTAWARKKV